MTTLDKSFVTNGVWKEDIFKGKAVFVTGGAGTICRVQVEAMVLLGADAVLEETSIKPSKRPRRLRN